jgi:hypothetical protein
MSFELSLHLSRACLGKCSCLSTKNDTKRRVSSYLGGEGAVRIDARGERPRRELRDGWGWRGRGGSGGLRVGAGDLDSDVFVLVARARVGATIHVGQVHVDVARGLADALHGRQPPCTPQPASQDEITGQHTAAEHNSRQHAAAAGHRLRQRQQGTANQSSD